MKCLEWNSLEWLKKIEKAKDYDEIRKLRKEVYLNTIELVKEGRYCIEGVEIKFQNFEELREKALFYDKPPRVAGLKKTDGIIKVLNEDCLESAKRLKREGKNPGVLNMANRQVPGGGVLNGSQAQEEQLFRRTGLFNILYQYYEPHGNIFGVPQKREQYPMNRETGGIYTPDVPLFRNGEKFGYSLMEKIISVSFISVAAINKPELILENGEERIIEKLIEPTKEKIRTVLRIAALHKHENLILSAFGCGAFKNPPKHMAELFKETFEEKEFKGIFREIIFAIIDDKNAKGNYAAFKKVLGEENS